MSEATTAAVAKPAGNRLVDFLRGSALAFAVLCAALLIYTWGRTQGTAPLAYADGALQNLANVLAPLVALAVFIERAVEVVITAWRNQGALDREHALRHATGQSAQFARMELDRYRHKTQRLSFLTALTLSLVAAMVGVRAIAGLVADAPVAGPFAVFDIAVTGLLLAGGADGIHQVVTTITDFLDSTKARMNPQPPPQPGSAGGGAAGEGGAG